MEVCGPFFTKLLSCQEWKPEDLIFTGRLRVVAVGDNCFIRIDNPQTLQLFAECPYTGPDCVERALDSSRYFIIKIQDPASKRVVQVGIGFEQREESFDFNIALQDVMRTSENAAKAVEPGPKLDLGLKQGESIKLNIALPKKKKAAAPAKAPGGFSLGLAPPPKRK